ncbi:MAG TPA: UDP-N-acetylmuramoyl-L-alanyl-D-glutamate--2,6-diaminopimelate ligase [Gammaproteobacteria bacterium]|nr:UDP-N-acetylmuramoyl-L-alanyl-D-glutamate--2,6-diaminopimelate ligase [Gammaproteobacteria bacterium]
MNAGPIRLADLLRGIADAGTAGEVRVRGVCLDSREAQEGFLFMACRGIASHGLDYLEQALQRGARVVLWEPAPHLAAPVVPAGTVALEVPALSRHVGTIAARFFGDPSRTLRIMGVTGTNGKTSCSQILAQALSEAGEPCGVMGTLGYGLYGRLEPATHTTPDAVRVQATLAAFLAQGARYVSMEVSSHALDQDRVAGTRFEVAVFTNLTRDHLDYHRDLESYAAAKRRLFEWPDLAYAVVNADDPLGREILAGLRPGVTGIAYGLDPAEVQAARAAQRLWAERVELHGRGLSLDVAGDQGRGRLEARLLGRFNASNLLAVLGALTAFGMPFERALAQLARARTVPGRMECFGGGDRPLAVVDYAHTPDALGQVLRAARAHCRGTLWCVFGCGGDRDRGKRPEMGAIAARFADRVIVTDDNPRTEDPDAIVAAILDGIEDRARVEVERDRGRAIASALGRAAPGDVVLIAGKGHEDYQIYGTEKRPYSDRATVARLLGETPP